MNPSAPDLPRLAFDWKDGADFGIGVHHEWLMTNGRGGYASGTLVGCNTRRYHGLFIPTLEKLGRTVLMARLDEAAIVDGQRYRLTSEEHADGTTVEDGARHLRHFHLEGLVPVWEYAVGRTRLRRRFVMVHGEDTVFITWEHLSGPEATLHLRPFPVLRPHDGPLRENVEEAIVTLRGPLVTLRNGEDGPSMRMRLYSDGPTPFVSLEETSRPQHLRMEKARGYDFTEVQHSPGYFTATLKPGGTLGFGLTTQSAGHLERDPAVVFERELARQQRLLERAPEPARSGVQARLVLAADQFIIDPPRPADAAWARSMGLDARSVIAGYPWFTDWGRDTMISLDGLTLATGRYREAAAILRTFEHYVRDGLIPNYFPDGENEGVYHTADATLWFFHAVDRYLEETGDETLLRDLYPTLSDIVAHHQKGTRFNIGVDPADGLLRQGQEGYQLTWMDAKVEGWVVTPRRGKAVELNALWFNALKLMAGWAERLDQESAPYRAAAERVHGSFNQRFWNEAGGCLYDVVDGEGVREDAHVRPNQVFAISLKHPVLKREHWAQVLDVVRRELVTPVGLRSLAPGSRDYKPKYDGDLRARDAAYHQGTVWGWLIGHYVDATLKVTPDLKAARALLAGMEDHLSHGGIGQISEIFDATEPYRPRGCFAQAWSVAEALRVFSKTNIG
ncbi:glycogen debranching protein [Corallococcus praedator]|uniref:Glycogen debranching protein n=1 Tax=Corallococcus praedator TaxID=2316724 RepID=A0ABX9QL69_9BACT|nr:MULTISPECIES: amylo-alpha-1,6-glucosidase [Corallococcus]RKH27845.1 glycogen debranching protein [Corallococcus sp. CA031C]RKI11769.1 glycogen debranching protein [Corallococcus praedator]